MRLIRALQIVIVLAVLANIAWLYQPPRLFVLTIAGRSSVCSMAQSLESFENGRRLLHAHNRIAEASRILDKHPAGYNLWATPKGRFWVPAGSDGELPVNLAEQEIQIYRLGDTEVHPGDVVLDCGANIGVYTREALTAGAALVVAVEPAPENIWCLRRNFAPEINSGRVIVYEKGVWDKDDVLTLQVKPGASGADSFARHPPGSIEGPKVPLTTIDKLVAELNLRRVDFVKMDIEGAEQRALLGAQKTIAKYRPRMALSVYHLPDDVQEIPRLTLHAWPGYNVVCGPCFDLKTRIAPQVFFFH